MDKTTEIQYTWNYLLDKSEFLRPPHLSSADNQLALLLAEAYVMIKDDQKRIAELEAFVEKAMSNPMIAGMIDD